jgi:hypothetical protein
MTSLFTDSPPRLHPARRLKSPNGRGETGTVDGFLNVRKDDDEGVFADYSLITGTLTFGPSGNPMIAFEEPKE